MPIQIPMGHVQPTTQTFEMLKFKLNFLLLHLLTLFINVTDSTNAKEAQNKKR